MSPLTYSCPLCGGAASVAPDLVGGNVVCPHCAKEFFASAPDRPLPPARETPNERVPFFKSSRLEVLQKKLDALTWDGDFSAEDGRALFLEALRLRLSEKDIAELRKKAVDKALESVKARVESTFHLTEADEARIAAIGRAFDANITIDPALQRYRDIYRIEVKGELPPPLESASFLMDPGEAVYHTVQTTWMQMRVQRKGYVGTSVSIPTGLKGVRFRFGDIQPITREALSPLAEGTLNLTNCRLFFDGDRRNTAIKLSKVLNLNVYKDGLEIEKQTGRSDIFTMAGAEARFFAAMVRALRK